MSKEIFIENNRRMRKEERGKNGRRRGRKIRRREWGNKKDKED